MTAQSQNVFLHAIQKLESGNITQTLTAGADWTRVSRSGPSSFQAVETPRYLDRSALPSSTTTTSKFGFFAEDSLEYGDLRAVAGLRLDHHRGNESNTATAWSPRFGAPYLITPHIVPFANVMMTSAPNFGYQGADGSELTEKWNALQYEAGLRVAPVRDFWLGVSFFRTAQNNTPLSLTGNPNDPFVSDGETVSQGVEISAVGNVLRNWSIHAAYTFIDFDDKNSAKKYDRFPRNAASLFTTYKFEDGAFNGVVLGFGARWRGGFDQTTRGMYQGAEYRVNGYEVFDASIEMPLPKLGDTSLSLAVKNILDKRYVESARNMQCFIGDPRTFEVALRVKF
jgi:iron complex outermembrane receptor protein